MGERKPSQHSGAMSMNRFQRRQEKRRAEKSKRFENNSTPCRITSMIKSMKFSLKPFPSAKVKAALASIQLNKDWWRISGHFSLLSRHTQMGKSQTKRIMEHIAAY
jgi:hypothetical protein